MKSSFVFLSLLACASTTVASTITLTSLGNGSPNYTTSDGAPVPDGSLVQLGFFDNFADDESTLRNASFSDSLEAFNAIASVSFGNGFGAPGELFVAIDGINDGVAPAPASYQDGGGNTQRTAFAVLVYNAPTAADATEAGIFTVTAGGWNVPSDPLSDDFLNTNEGVSAVQGTIVGDGDAGQLQLIAVPEPSSAGLLALAGLGLIVRRRR